MFLSTKKHNIALYSQDFAVIKVGALHDDLVEQTDLVVGAHLAAFRHKDVLVVLIKHGDLAEARQIAVFHIDALFAVHDVQRLGTDPHALEGFEVDAGGGRGEAQHVRAHIFTAENELCKAGVLIHCDALHRGGQDLFRRAGETDVHAGDALELFAFLCGAHAVEYHL